MKDNQRTPDNQRPLVYRIYLNIKDKQKAEFIEDYIKRFQESKREYRKSCVNKSFRDKI